MAHRRSDLPELPRPHADRISHIVLQQHGSTPGADGNRHEVLHRGVWFTANLVTQLHYELQERRRCISWVLGNEPDFLIWIPKKDDARTPETSRPLQLTAALKRLTGTTIADTIASTVERRKQLTTT